MKDNAVHRAAELMDEARRLLSVDAGVQTPGYVLSEMVPVGVQLYANQARSEKDKPGIWWYYLILPRGVTPKGKTFEDGRPKGWMHNEKGYYWCTNTGRTGPYHELGWRDFPTSDQNTEQAALKAGLRMLLDSV